MTHLKPCPHCGCDTVTIYYDHPESVGHGGGFYLSHPLWKEYPVSWGCERALPTEDYFRTEEEAAAAWNDWNG